MAISAGYSATPLVKKLGIKAGYSLLLVNTPKNYLDLLGVLPADVTEHQNGLADFIHLFVKDQKTLTNGLAELKLQLSKTGMLWISWPKKASKIVTDVNDRVVREAGLKAGLVDVKVCAVDETWSGLKFMYRVKDR